MLLIFSEKEAQLRKASKDGDLDRVRELLNQGTDVDAADSDQNTALQSAGKSMLKHFWEEKNFGCTCCSKNFQKCVPNWYHGWLIDYCGAGSGFIQKSLDSVFVHFKIVLVFYWSSRTLLWS